MITRSTEHLTKETADAEIPLKNAAGASTDGKEEKVSIGADTDGKSKAPKHTNDGKSIHTPEELVVMWKEFLGTKFTETERERLCKNFEAFIVRMRGPPEVMLTREEF